MMAHLRGHFILVVDNHDDSRELLEVTLRNAGASTVAVATAYEAILSLQVARFSCVVVDLRLPLMDGCGFAHAARVHRLGEGTPLLAVTSRTDDVAQTRAIAAGYAKVLLKPVDPFRLDAAIASIRQGAHAEPLESRVQRRDVRGALESLNSRTRFRFSAMRQFERQFVCNVWTYDRDHPSVDALPPLLTGEHTWYCQRVRDQRVPVVITGWENEERSPRRNESGIKAYCGVPLSQDGRVAGSLCHYDHVPHERDTLAVCELERAACLFQSSLKAVHSAGPVQN